MMCCRQLFGLGLPGLTLALGALCAPQTARAQVAPEAPTAPAPPELTGFGTGSPAAALVGEGAAAPSYGPTGDASWAPLADTAYPGPENPSGPQIVDPPGRVGRVRVLEGKASLLPLGAHDWLDAANNRPLTQGDKLYVGKRSRAMVQLGTATVYLGPNTVMSVAALTQDALNVALGHGDLLLHLQELRPSESAQVMMTGAVMQLRRGGQYRLHRRQSGALWAGVVHGEALVQTPEGTQSLTAGDLFRHAVAQKTDPATASEQVAHGQTFDDPLTQACKSDLQRLLGSQTLRYVSQDLVGYDDLDAQGSWQEAPQYGAVWTPRGMPEGWAPYRFGHWASIAPWGWTWIDDASWGFAPFHYGRWVFVEGAWAWAPGAIDHRPLYAPHLVTFLRGSVGAQVGWLPLGYGDPFAPGYAASTLYLHQINGGFVAVVGLAGQGFRNCGVPYAATVVPWSAWGGAGTFGAAAGPRPFRGSPHPFNVQDFGALAPLGYPHGPPGALGAPLGRVRPHPALMRGPVTGLAMPWGSINLGAPGRGRAGGPFLPQGAPPRPRPQTPPLAPFRPPPIGHHGPMGGAHTFRPSPGHPGFGGHMGAPSYHGGGGGFAPRGRAGAGPPRR